MYVGQGDTQERALELTIVGIMVGASTRGCQHTRRQFVSNSFADKAIYDQITSPYASALGESFLARYELM